MAKIKSGDLVQVISGADKGKQGKVLKVIPKENRVIVEGVKVVTKHTDGQDFLRTSVIGDLQSRLLLNHISPVVSPVPTRLQARASLAEHFYGID